MGTISVLKKRLESVDKKDYGAYQSLKGEYDYSRFKLLICQIPKDPYAPPHTGIYRVIVKNDFSGQFNDIFNNLIRI